MFYFIPLNISAAVYLNLFNNNKNVTPFKRYHSLCSHLREGMFVFNSIDEFWIASDWKEIRNIRRCRNETEFSSNKRDYSFEMRHGLKFWNFYNQKLVKLLLDTDCIVEQKYFRNKNMLDFHLHEIITSTANETTEYYKIYVRKIDSANIYFMHHTRETNGNRISYYTIFAASSFYTHSTLGPWTNSIIILEFHVENGIIRKIRNYTNQLYSVCATQDYTYAQLIGMKCEPKLSRALYEFDEHGFLITSNVFDRFMQKFKSRRKRIELHGEFPNVPYADLPTYILRLIS